MNRALILETVGEQGVTPVATLSNDESILGRDPDEVAGGPEVIRVDFGAISREHGKILRVRNHWFFFDLHSTNGSWINGTAVPAEQWRLLRPNDYLQLADQAFRVREGDKQGGDALEMGVQRPSGRSLIVFSDGQFADEFPIPEFGKALVVGGAQADLEIRGDVFERPGLVVERRAQGVCAYAVEAQQNSLLNGEEMSETVDIKDRDVIRIKEHHIIYNDPPILTAGGLGKSMLGGAGGDESRIKSWGGDSGPDLMGGQENPAAFGGMGNSDPGMGDPGHGGAGDWSESAGAPKKPALSGQFGRAPEVEDLGHDETVAIDSGQFHDSFRVSEQHPATRFSYEDTSEYSYSSTEDKITIFVAIFLLILLMVLIVWWVFLV